MPRARSAIEAVCYIDFSGNLEDTLCGEDAELAITAGKATVYLSGATCLSCKALIAGKLDQLARQVGGAGGDPGAAIAASTVLRMSASEAPPSREIRTP